MSAETDAVYAERDQCVALIAKMALALGYPVVRARKEIEGWDPEWLGCVYIQLPTGQVSWHFHDREAHWFDGLPVGPVKWDGHDTPEKYRRVNACQPTPPSIKVRQVERVPFFIEEESR